MRMIAGSRRFEVGPRENNLTMAPGKVAPFVAAAIAWLASGCGGGGGGGDSNAAPVIGTAAFSTNEDTALTGQLTATDADGDGVTFAKSSDPGSGTVTISSAGGFVYTPNANANGNDAFGVRLTDARGGSVTSMVSVSIAAVADAPAVVNDVRRVDGAALASIDVKGNDSDGDGDAFSIAIEEAASVGTAVANSDGTVRLDMPANFKGVTRFKYKATDSSGLSSVATAAIFVGTDPFRVAFVGDENANGRPEVFMTDFVATFQLTSAAEGSLRLRAFSTADNGSTIAYTRRDGPAGPLDLSFVKTSDTSTQVRVTLPSGYSIAAGANQFVVSPDGHWLAFLASTSTPTAKSAPFILNVDTPTSIRNLEASSSATYASQIKFSQDSSFIYFLGSNTGAAARTLYRAQVSGNAAGTPVSASSGNISDYLISRDQTRIAITATRGGSDGVYTINPATPGTEVPLSGSFVVGETIESSTLSNPLGLGNPTDGAHIAYTSRAVLNRLWVADVNAASGPAAPTVELIAPYQAVGLSPNGDALLYTAPAGSLPFQTQIYEIVLGGGSQATAVGDGTNAVYDSTQETLILTEPVGGSNILTASYRPFGSTTQLGTPGQVARFFGLSGAARAVALIGEGASSGSVTSTHLALFNARAPAVPLFLGAFNSPLDFNSDLATVVTY